MSDDKDTLTVKLWTLKHQLNQLNGAKNDLDRAIVDASSPETAEDLRSLVGSLDDRIEELKAQIAEFENRLAEVTD